MDKSQEHKSRTLWNSKCGECRRLNIDRSYNLSSELASILVDEAVKLMSLQRSYNLNKYWYKAVIIIGPASRVPAK